MPMTIADTRIVVPGLLVYTPGKGGGLQLAAPAADKMDDSDSERTIGEPLSPGQLLKGSAIDALAEHWGLLKPAGIDPSLIRGLQKVQGRRSRRSCGSRPSCRTACRATSGCATSPWRSTAYGPNSRAATCRWATTWSGLVLPGDRPRHSRPDDEPHRLSAGRRGDAPPVPRARVMRELTLALPSGRLAVGHPGQAARPCTAKAHTRTETISTTSPSASRTCGKTRRAAGSGTHGSGRRSGRNRSTKSRAPIRSTTTQDLRRFACPPGGPGRQTVAAQGDPHPSRASAAAGWVVRRLLAEDTGQPGEQVEFFAPGDRTQVRSFAPTAKARSGEGARPPWSDAVRTAG